MKKIKINKKIICLLIIDIIICLRLFLGEMPKGHDMMFHLSRIQGLADTIESGSFYAPIHVGLYGYGYANGLFYSNLFFYFPSLLVRYGIPLLTAYKIFIILINIVTSMIMYYVMKRITKKEEIAFFSSVLYTTCCYRITDVVIRAAIGEVLAYAFIPLILLGLYEIINGDSKKWYIFMLGFILTLHSHIITTIIMFIFSFIIILLNIKKIIKEKRLKYFIYSALLGILLSAYFIFPLLEQYLSDKFVLNTATLATETWRRAIEVKDIFVENFFIMNKNLFTPVGIGIIFVIISILRIKIKEKSDLMKLCDFCLITGIIYLICTTNIFPWKLFNSLLAFIQFPWRMYLPATLFLSISSGIILSKILLENKDKKRWTIIVILYAISVGTLLPFYYSFEHYEKYYYDISFGEYLPAHTSLNELRNRGKVITSNNGEIDYSYDKNNLTIEINYDNNKNNDTYLEVPLLYYKGYKAISLVDGIEYKLEKGQNNIIKINLEKNSNHIKIYYAKTTVQRVSILVTLITIFSILIFHFYRRVV